MILSLGEIRQAVEYHIAATPTGPTRELLTVINMTLMVVQSGNQQQIAGLAKVFDHQTEDSR